MRSTGQLVPKTTRSGAESLDAAEHVGPDALDGPAAGRPCRGRRSSCLTFGDRGHHVHRRAPAPGNMPSSRAIGMAQWSTQISVSGKPCAPDRRMSAASSTAACRCRRRGCAARAAAKPRRQAGIDRDSRPSPKSRMPRTLANCMCRSSTAPASGSRQMALGDDAVRIAGLVGEGLQPARLVDRVRRVRPPPAHGPPWAHWRSGSRRCSP